MTKLEFKKLLTKLGACQEAVVWAKGKTFKEVWETCERGDWLLWLVGNMADKHNWPTRKQVVLAACGCAETALKYIPDVELRPKQCIDLTRRWASGDQIITLDDLRAAASAAASAAAEAAAWAAWAAEAAKAAAWAASAAEAAAWAVAWAAARAAEAAAWAAASADSLKECADIVRKELTPFLQEVLK